MSYIEIENLSYKYPDSHSFALENINLNINKGDIELILGSSGSGKSTLAKAICGSIPSFYGGTISGNVLLEGKNIDEIDYKDRAKEITMVFQDPERQLVMDKVHREIAFGLENVGTPESQFKRRIWESLQFLNITDLAYRDIETLSGGQKQKVAIASALAYMPSCIILDEPTSQLDPSASEEIINIVKKMNEELGITIIVIEQKIGKWFDSADNISILKSGKLLISGERKAIYSSNEKDIFSFLPSNIKLFKLLGKEDMPDGLKECRRILNEYSFNNKVVDTFKEYKNILIEIKDLNCKYDSIEAIKGLNINIFEKDFIGIIGANGAGKSTLLKAIMGLVKYSGSIKLPQGEVKKLKVRELAKFIGYVSQNPNDYISKDTVYEELKFTLENYNIKDQNIIDETLKALDIYHLKYVNPRDTSGGERERIAIASILVLKPNVLLLDEPTRGLNEEAKRKLGQILIKLRDEGATILMVTHDIEFASLFCSRFILMFDGQKASDGDRKEVLGNSIYYTTTINKLLRDKNENIFTLQDVLNGV